MLDDIISLIFRFLFGLVFPWLLFPFAMIIYTPYIVFKAITKEGGFWKKLKNGYFLLYKTFKKGFYQGWFS